MLYRINRQKQRNTIAVLCYMLVFTVAAQSVGINVTSPNVNATLELGSTDKGLLPNRISLTATNDPSPLAAHVAGMLVYNTAVTGTGSVAVSEGYYYNDGTQWTKLELFCYVPSIFDTMYMSGPDVFPPRLTWTTLVTIVLPEAGTYRLDYTAGANLISNDINRDILETRIYDITNGQEVPESQMYIVASDLSGPLSGSGNVHNSYRSSGNYAVLKVTGPTTLALQGYLDSNIGNQVSGDGFLAAATKISYLKIHDH